MLALLIIAIVVFAVCFQQYDPARVFIPEERNSLVEIASFCFLVEVLQNIGDNVADTFRIRQGLFAVYPVYLFVVE
mgnify:FL=1